MNLNARISLRAVVRSAATSRAVRWAMLISGTVVFWPGSAAGLGVRIPNQDAEAIARGNAFAATADNPSAIYYNPAGITQLPGENISVGVLNYLGINTTYKSPTGMETDSKFQVLPIPQLYGTFTPGDFPLSFGLGVYAPFGLATKWPDDSNFRSLALDATLTYVTLNPVVAWKINKSLSIGIGPTVNYSQLKITRGLASPADFFDFYGDGFSYGFNAGILWQPLEQWSFGANYRSTSTMKYEGHSTYNVPMAPAFQTPTTAEIQYPEIVSGGISFRPTPKWNIEADVDWTDWNSVKTVSRPHFGHLRTHEHLRHDLTARAQLARELVLRIWRDALSRERLVCERGLFLQHGNGPGQELHAGGARHGIKHRQCRLWPQRGSLALGGGGTDHFRPGPHGGQRRAERLYRRISQRQLPALRARDHGFSRLPILSKDGNAAWLAAQGKRI